MMLKERKKILMLPLDERPCNYLFPQFLLENNPEYELIMPERCRLGRKKMPADHAYIESFLLKNASAADMAVVSVDMLLFGGLLYGRLHRMTEETLVSRLRVLERLKEINPALKIYAFHLIMRCPQYSSAEEEPDYYGECGREIFLLGEALHKRELGILRSEDEEKIELWREKTAGVLGDYLCRRKINTEMNCKTIDLVGTAIDFLVIPQDDSSVYGYVARDQQKVRDYVRTQKKQFLVNIYPGADEVGMTLLSRAILEDGKRAPRIYPFYSSSAAPFLVPRYEDRMLGESVKAQISAAGCRVTSERNAADILLAVNAPSRGMLEADGQSRAGCEYNVNRNLTLFAQEIVASLEEGKPVAVADVAYSNGGDLELASLLDTSGAALKVSAYGGWNTSGNTLGTAISQAALSLAFGVSGKFLALRYFEDVGFCAYSRAEIAQELSALDCGYNDLREKGAKIAALVKEKTAVFMRELMPTVCGKYELTSCAMPWNRMFETEFFIDEK